MNKYKTYYRIVKRIGFFRSARTLIKKFLGIKSNRCLEYWYLFGGKTGLEIGGPTSVFTEKGFFPVYEMCKGLDNANYKETNYEPSKGRRYTLEATELKGIPNNTYDFVLASHVLEHVANPLKAVKEWKRVLKKGGALLIIVPDKNRIFDHEREYTNFSHLLDDYNNKVTEKDSTHMSEIVILHDLYGEEITRMELLTRCLNNFSNRNMHHHVFNAELLEQIINYAGFNIVDLFKEDPYHIIIIGVKK